MATIVTADGAAASVFSESASGDSSSVFDDSASRITYVRSAVHSTASSLVPPLIETLPSSRITSASTDSSSSKSASCVSAKPSPILIAVVAIFASRSGRSRGKSRLSQLRAAARV